MDEEDFLGLIDLFKNELAARGLAEIGEDRHFLDANSLPDGVARFMPPKAHLLELLRAFERHLLANSVSTARTALTLINESIESEVGPISDIEITEIQSGADLDDGEAGVSILEAADYDECLSVVRNLIKELENPSDGLRER